MNTFDAYFDSFTGPANPTRAEIVVQVTDLTAAQELAAKFPKSVKAVAIDVSNTDYALVKIVAKLVSNGTHGARNETGIKRLRAAEKVLAAEGIDLAFGDRPANWINVYRDRAEFDAAIA